MSPLLVEAFTPTGWIPVLEMGPDAEPRNMSSVQTDRSREMYYFYCVPDDSHSVIKKLPPGLELDLGNKRGFILDDIKKAEIVTLLRRGDPPYRMTVQTDHSPARRIIRFSHK